MFSFFLMCEFQCFSKFLNFFIIVGTLIALIYNVEKMKEELWSLKILKN